MSRLPGHQRLVLEALASLPEGTWATGPNLAARIAVKTTGTVPVPAVQAAVSTLLAGNLAVQRRRDDRFAYRASAAGRARLTPCHLCHVPHEDADPGWSCAEHGHQLLWTESGDWQNHDQCPEPGCPNGRWYG